MRKGIFVYSRAVQAAIMSISVLLLMIAGGATATDVLANSAVAARANLQHTPTGTADLHVGSYGYELTVSISLTGLAPNSIHPAHIHAGNSCASNGAILYSLKNVVANEKGQASVTTVVHLSHAGIPVSGWYINVHNGPTLKTPQQAYAISCGVVSNPSYSSDVLTALGPTPDPNQHSFGFTTLSLKDGKLTVHIMVTGLAPYTKHAAHIHAGDCFYTRQVLYDLSPLVANDKGVAYKTVTFKDVDSVPAYGWDVNVHFSTNLSTQTGYDPILCGNVARDDA
jgi:Cu/Zn superoxide dismutase